MKTKTNVIHPVVQACCIVGAILLQGLWLAACATNNSNSVPASSGTAKTSYAAEEKKATIQKLTGEIVSVDNKCLKIKGSRGEVEFAITGETGFVKPVSRRGNEAVIRVGTMGFSDFKCGDKVVVEFKQDGDKKIALTVKAH